MSPDEEEEEAARALHSATRADIGSHLELIVTSLIYAKLKKLESKLFERERERDEKTRL